MARHAGPAGELPAVIVLDTNVVSALMRGGADRVVADWLDRQPAESVWLSAVTVFEIEFGVRRLAAGRRRRQLEIAFQQALAEDFEGRILPFDETAARAAGALAVERERVGRTVEFRDVQIAGIVRARRATLATRNRRHFDGLGLSLVDPWTA